MLHQSFLGWQQQWLKVLSKLRMVILDEIHEYQGYFGTNVALLPWRFFARLDQLGLCPQTVLATAACGNAEEHAFRLTGRRCTLVRAPAAARPERHFAFINPDIPAFRLHDISRLRIARAALACVAQGFSTLIFCPSPQCAEEAANRVVVAHAAGEVQLEDVEPQLRTEGIFYTVTQGAEILAGICYAENLAAYYGRLTVFENFAGFRLIDTRSGEVINEERSQLARSSKVRGFWLELTDPAILGDDSNAGDLFGAEQLLRIGAPFIVPCDRHDLGTWTTRKHPPTVYLYETVSGGIGVAEKALQVWPAVVATAIGIAERCPCRHGCPSCLVPPRLPPGFDAPRKGPAIAIGRRFLDLASARQRERFDPKSHAWVAEP